MKTPGKALFIIGSPRRRKSTSYILAAELAGRLRAHGWVTEDFFAAMPGPGQTELAMLAAAVDAADLIVASFPLYVDQLPSGLVAALEHLHLARGGRSAKPRGVVAIVNCGFPESHQNDTAVDILKRFAAIEGFEWLGGLSRGMGGGIAARRLPDAGICARGVGPALDMAADAISRGEAIPSDACRLMSRPPFPKWIYRLFANIDWYRRACGLGTAGRLRSVPTGDPDA